MPLSLIVTAPFVPFVTDATSDTLPSISVSFANTSIVTAASSFVSTESVLTTVKSFTASTVTLTVAVVPSALV